MQPAFVKKHTAGGAAGIEWEAGEVKPLHPHFAKELTQLSSDFEIVSEGEYTAAPPAHNQSPIPGVHASTDGQGITFQHQETSNIEVEVEGSVEANEATAQALSEKPAKVPVKKAPAKKTDAK